MNINLWGVSAAVVALLFFRHVYLHAGQRSAGRRMVLGLCLLPPSVLAAGFVVYYFHLLPEWAWFYELRSWRGSEFLMVCLGALMGILASGFSRWTMILWLFLVMGCVAVPFAKPVIAPLVETELKDRWNKNACLQSTSSTCGPASVATILKKMGCSVTEQEVARAAYSYAGGTEAWYLARFIRSKGFDAHFEFRDAFAPNAPMPAVAGVRVGGGHFIALLGKEGEKYVVADPLFGELRVSETELRDRYNFTGFFLVIGKN